MSQICGNDLQFSLTRRTRRRDMRTSFGETDRSVFPSFGSLLRSHRPSVVRAAKFIRLMSSFRPRDRMRFERCRGSD